MIEQIDPIQLPDNFTIPVIDVRSPSEFVYGHIPCAISIPLFDDEERALVGTRYHNSGKDAGFMLGLEIAGPKLGGYVKKLHSVVPVHSPIIVYCWRGGMRSNSMAWLFSQAGYDVQVIKGGYKAFRSYIREEISTKYEFTVIGGMTGSGKTEVLSRLKQLGHQVIDLEALACHKGSVFGHLGQQEQPNNEWFEILIWDELRKLDPSKPVFIEDESRSIGKVSLPEPFFMKLQHSPICVLQVDVSSRINRLVEDYGNFPCEVLIDDIDKLKKYLGGEMHAKVVTAVMTGDLHSAVGMLLSYYDKKYSESVVRHRIDNSKVRSVECSGDINSIVDKLLENTGAVNQLS